MLHGERGKAVFKLSGAVSTALLLLLVWPARPVLAEGKPLDLSAEPIQPLQVISGLDKRKVELGRKLFHEPRLSIDGSISCASCHDLSNGGSDHQARSVGVKGAEGSIRAPTVYNAALNFVQFWDGRAASLEEQVSGPVTNPVEMASNWDHVTQVLAADRDYAAAFRDIYGRPAGKQTVSDAIATFERSLIAVNSRFDAFLRGDAAALSDDERKGYELFKSYGCASCHQGANVGGNMFEKFGFLGDYLTERGQETAADQGRFNVTGWEGDRHVFKVPSLRMVASGGPYFHDGSALDLDTAVSVMARYQLGRDIPKHDVQKIILFLDSLMGETAPEPKVAP